ncbi:cell division topological specificity factor MinE [Thermoanaerobacterium thermosaccharolyticum]|jgi:cell division topological specificity factor|uniref:Cell division topological specificity factor n=3 Tax=Thermoanaerobacterium thermosaccharolyticum TaxID=1517 RepID=D9TP31_THETC|nr:cell division topological specificity factor MinE [Thermoanaerobacterium thermosaccharolyticum]TCW41960.1 cell division topological specificity factor [Thermohydrogenium kirishiense]ADL68650.1 cell division topological specificity factor MinE [Thermoanaerobacterium thermosaccharolyticum DSM 571]AGB18734.1 cell division topological specificity factor MinE [Thermoanaerobacterium thermosaccharolyticum M0795]AST56378.1 cell division topological specificity factor [Thermoanaerobacterium thermosac
MDLFKSFGGKSNSKNVAKERLQLLLVHDRADVSPKFLELMKGEIMNVISNYVEIDEDGLNVEITKEKKTDDTFVPALHANIPIKKMKKNIR